MNQYSQTESDAWIFRLYPVYCLYTTSVREGPSRHGTSKEKYTVLPSTVLGLPDTTGDCDTKRGVYHGRGVATRNTRVNGPVHHQSPPVPFPVYTRVGERKVGDYTRDCTLGDLRRLISTCLTYLFLSRETIVVPSRFRGELLPSTPRHCGRNTITTPKPL